MKRTPLLWMLLPALLALFVSLPAEKPEEIADPMRTSGSFVSDGGGVLGPEYSRLIGGVCRELQEKTTVELAVVTVADLGGLEIEEFAEKVFRRLGVGARGKDNGLLLLLSRDDRAVRLEVGYGLEPAIPDALASRLLDENGLAELGRGQFGHGLFLAARAIAGAAAAAQGVPLAVADPPAWPGQPLPPAPLARPAPGKRGAWDPVRSSLYLAAGLLLLGLLGGARTLRRYHKARGKAARAKATWGDGPIALAWTAGVAGLIPVAILGRSFLPPFVAALAAPGLATAGQLMLGRLLKRRLSSYRLPCAKCGAAMKMVPESQDDQYLDEEQAAEERAGGMDYEVWRCAACGSEETLSTQLNKASKCPKCNRRSLAAKTAVLAAATYSSGGRLQVSETCLNPQCGFSRVSERTTPRLSHSSSSSSSSGFHGSSSRSSSSSFGGGRSGGAGASRKF